jgi:hypothetical protein
VGRSRQAPLLLLVGFGIVFGARAFGLDTPAFDDHPGQLYRLHHLIARGPAPWAWNPGWWAGYPDLQFYPPGYFYLGALAVWGSLGAVSAEVAYRALLWITFLAPGVTSYLTLARMLRNGWLALPGAFIALTVSAGLLSGVDGVHYGTLPARLAWSLLPLLVLALEPWLIESHRTPWIAAPLLALIALIHPAQGPAAVALVGVAAWSGPGPRAHRCGAAMILVGMAALLTAFWTLPLLARLEQARALAVSELALRATLTTYPLLAILLIVAALGIRTARSPTDAVILRWPWAALALVLADAIVVEPLGIRWLPADRVADGAWLAVILAAGLVVGWSLERLETRLPAPALALGALGLVAVLGMPGRALSLWPHPADWPSQTTVEQGFRLDRLWAALRRAPEGRVLFVRSALPLVFGRDWWRPHSHITALTPLRAGRPIVHGTFTHPSPVAALVYRGEAGPAAITSHVERLDGHTLLGRPLENLDTAALDAYSERLGISVIVALDEDAPRLAALESQSAFKRRTAVGPFWIYERLTPLRLPVPAGPGRWIVMFEGERGPWAPARVAYSPLWRAERQGARLETRRGPAFDLELRPGGLPGPVMLVYGPGIPERSGVIVSALAAAGWVALAWRQRRLRH